MKKLFKKIVVTCITALAKAALRAHKPKVIAVVGSVGKTSTKDAIHVAIRNQLRVRKSEKSYNSEVGVPLAVLGLPNAWSNPFLWTLNFLRGLAEVVRPGFPTHLLLEIGADHPGDISSVMEWLAPHVVVVTRFGKVPVHIEYFKDREQLIAEDAEAVRALKKDGVLVVNQDDEDALALQDLTKARVVRYGERGEEFGFEHYRTMYDEGGLPEGITYKVTHQGANFPVRLYGVLGKTPVYASLAALAVAKALELNILESAGHLEEMRTPPGRLKLIRGLKDTMVIDDTYNASPVATEEALSTLRNLEVKRKIAVLGDMLELGGYSDGEHLRIGTVASESCDVLLTVGERARRIAEGAFEAGFREKNLYQWDDAKSAGRFLQNFIVPGDVILIKGSQGMRMERAVEEVMKDPDKKRELLVRQDKEWRRR